MPVATSNQFLETLRKSGLIDESVLDGALSAYTGTTEEPIKIAEYLIQKKLLTSFQAKSLLTGRYKGLIIGAYRVLDKIGAGGMGIVYLAEHEKLKRRVAIKVLPEDKTRDKLALERFYREARAAAALDHPNIVKAFDVSAHNGTHYLVMEYIDGANLQKYVDSKGPLPWKTAINIVIQSCKGLQHAHERNMVHRDIKPANILVDRTGQVKILDLGLARSFRVTQDNLTQDLSDGKDVMGSIDYIAPEQAIANKAIDTRADIYSLGATLYSLITGRPPVEGTTAQKLLQHQMQMPTPINRLKPEVPDAIANIVAKMMAKKPEYRFQSPNEVIAALTPFVSSNSQAVPGLSATQFNTAPIHPSTGQLLRPTGSLTPTAPINGASGAVSSQSTKIETKRSSRKSKKLKRKNALNTRLSSRTIMIIGAIALVLIPAVTIFVINNSSRKPSTEVDLSMSRSLTGDKYSIRANGRIPDIKLEDLNKGSFRLADYRGKVILLEFWGFWCSPSLKMLPNNKDLTDRYKDRPFAMVGINTDKQQDDLDKGMAKYSVNWRNVKNKQTDGSLLTQSFGVKSSPTIVLIDSAGTIRHVWEGYVEPEKMNPIIDGFVVEAETRIQREKESEARRAAANQKASGKK